MRGEIKESRLAYKSEWLEVYAPPPRVKSLEPLIVKWWNWWLTVPADTATNWPQCIKGDVEHIGNNQSIVFFGNPAQAVDKNVNPRNQKCEISSNQLIYLTVYPGECSTGSKPHEGEFPDTKNAAQILYANQQPNHSNSLCLRIMLLLFQHLSLAEIIHQWPRIIICFSKALPVGDHMVELEVIRQPLQANQPVEHDVAKWNIKVVP